MFKKPSDAKESEFFANEAVAVLKKLLKGMGVEASVESSHNNNRLVLNTVCGQDDSIVIGRKGKTLDAIQYIINRIVRRNAEDQKPIIVDVSGYRDRRKRNLTDLAHRSAERVKEVGYPVITGPFNSYERHIVHAAAQDDPDVITESQGEGTVKKIIFKLRSSADNSAPEG